MASTGSNSSKTIRLCSVEDCSEKHYGRGFCRLHYQRARRDGTIPTAPCKVEDCDRPSDCKGLCTMHYRHARREGTIPAKKCTETDCERPVEGRGLCAKHRERARLAGLLDAPECSEADCDQAVKARGLCRTHYERWIASGGFGVCGIRGCENPSRFDRRKICTMHYRRWEKDGHVGSAARRRAPDGAGHRTPQGYVRVSVNGKKYSQHRLVVEEAQGFPLAPYQTVHHKNGIRWDNRVENLEPRMGAHGTGSVVQCANCGSHDVRFLELSESEKPSA